MTDSPPLPSAAASAARLEAPPPPGRRPPNAAAAGAAAPDAPAPQPAGDAAADALAGRLRALGHPVRLTILQTLAQAQGCVCGEIVRGLPLAQSTVSQHLKVLAEAGLVCARTEGPRTAYCLAPQALAELRAELDHLLARLAPAPPCGDPGNDR